MDRKAGCFCSLLLVTLVGCAPDDARMTTRQPTPQPSATASAFINGGVCPPPPAGFPSDAGCVTRAGELAVYALLDEEGKPESWHTRLNGRVQPLAAGNAFSYPRAIAEVDVDDDGTDEWLVKTFDLASHGTNWQQLGLFVLPGERLVQVTYEGEPLAIRVGGTSRMGEGARCEAGRLILLRTVSEERQNTRWSFSETAYRIRGSVAKKGSLARGFLRLRDYNDPKLDPYYEIRCGGYTYP